MGAYIIDLDASLDLVLDECVFTAARLKALPLTAPHAAGFDAFLTDWFNVNNEEIQLGMARTAAHALMAAADEDLNDLSDAASKALLIITKNKRDDPEYVLYFGNKRASEFKRPMLGAQLEAMRGWVDRMKGSVHPMLVDLGQAVETRVAAADDSVKAVGKADGKIREFRTTGDRRRLIDSFNALRKATYGKLAEMPHAHPEMKLAGNFADRFFRPERVTAPVKEPTLPELEQQIENAKKQVANLEQKLADAKKVEADAVAAKAAKDADELALADAEKAEKEAMAKAEALRKKLGRG